MNPIQIIRAFRAMTQRELADAASTSQPTVAAYEAATKSPTWRTIERIGSAVQLSCYPSIGVAFTRDQARSIALHVAIVRELRARPDAVVDIARSNVATMRLVNPHAAPLLDEWERILAATIDQVAAAMIDPGEHGRDLRQVTPFAGVLPPAKRAQVYAKFGELK